MKLSPKALLKNYLRSILWVHFLGAAILWAFVLVFSLCYDLEIIIEEGWGTGLLMAPEFHYGGA